MVGTRRIGNNMFRLIDAFPTKAGAKGSAEDYRKSENATARVFDLGPGGGRLRYGVYAGKKRR